MYSEPNEALSHWYSLFKSVLDSHAPLKKRRVNREFIPEWFNSEIQAAIAKRNHLHRKAKLTNNALSWRDYRSARNRVVHLIRFAKRSFYRNSINNNLENPKNLWRIIRSLAPSKCSKLPNHLVIDGTNYHDYYDIANVFNEHFANISSSVQLNHVSDPPNWERIADYVDSKLPSGVSYCIPSISENFVRTSLQQLSTSKATGLDDLSSFFLKIAAPAISPSLTAVFNLSISSGVFPDLWKTAKVSPLHKDGSLFDRSNYRPISVLAVLSKILERHVHQTFYYFLSQHELLLDSQFGFRSSRSCELALANLSDNILTNMDNKLLNGLLLVDLKKAFDLVDHDTLLNKLRIYGCSHSTMAWFRSYLSGRSQKTQFRGTLSEALPVSVGVPQGSILGPLFFIMYMNDLPLELHSDVTSTMFADDTTILVRGPSVTSLSTQLNEVARTVSTWADNNRMSLNTTKTNSLLITTRQKRRTLTSSALNVQIDGRTIEQVDYAKLLGVMIDSDISWEHHIDTICCIISSRLSLLRRIKPYLNFFCFKILQFMC